jgi:hypothetical protein
LGIEPTIETPYHLCDFKPTYGVLLTRKMWKPIRSALSASIIEKTKSLRGPVRSIFFSPKTERPEMSPEVRSYLADVYAEPNRKLADWLGRNLSHWT